jgi:hypothetical protein
MTALIMVFVCSEPTIEDFGIDMNKSFLLIGGAVLLFMLLIVFVPQPKGAYINCGLSEISPDFTPEMRKLCRETRATKL